MTVPGPTPAAGEPIAATRTRASTPPRVELRGISKRFAATQALDDVSLDLLPGEVHALVGENGAGKSTLVKILAGVHQPDSGTIRLDGELTQIAGPAQARALGIAVVHQEPRLFPDLTVAENVFIGHAPSGRFGTIDWGATRRAAQALFDELEVRFDVGAPVRGLSMADQQLIEIAKSLSVDARVLILDEPTASLSAHEVERLFTIVRRLRDRGVVGPVREPPARRGVRAVRPGDRLPRRPPRRDHRDERADDGRPRPPHGRARGNAVPQGRDADRRRPARGRGADPGGRLPRHRVLGPGRRDRRVRRARRGRPDGDRAGPVRDRPSRCGRDPARRPARHLCQPVGRDAGGDRLSARGPPPGGPRPGLLDRPERHPADPAQALSEAARPASTERASPRTTPRSSTCG